MENEPRHHLSSKTTDHTFSSNQKVNPAKPSTNPSLPNSFSILDQDVNILTGYDSATVSIVDPITAVEPSTPSNPNRLSSILTEPTNKLSSTKQPSNSKNLAHNLTELSIEPLTTTSGPLGSVLSPCKQPSKTILERNELQCGGLSKEISNLGGNSSNPTFNSETDHHETSNSTGILVGSQNAHERRYSRSCPSSPIRGSSILHSPYETLASLGNGKAGSNEFTRHSPLGTSKDNRSPSSASQVQKRDLHGSLWNGDRGYELGRCTSPSQIKRGPETATSSHGFEVRRSARGRKHNSALFGPESVFTVQSRTGLGSGVPPWGRKSRSEEERFPLLAVSYNSMFLYWNTRGIARPYFKTNLPLLLQQHSPHMVILSELRVSRNNIEEIAGSLPFDDWIFVEPVGFSGGILILWRADFLSFKTIKMNRQGIHGIVQGSYQAPPWFKG